MSISNLKNEVKHQVFLLSSILEMSDDMAECLLYQFSWNKNRLITVS